MFAVWHRVRTVSTLECNSVIDDAHIRVSSTSFLAHGSPVTMTSDWQHHSSEEAFNPIGARRYRNFPCGRRNVVMKELF